MSTDNKKIRYLYTVALILGMVGLFVVTSKKKQVPVPAQKKMFLTSHGKLKLGGWSTEYKWYLSPGEYTEGFLDSAGHAWTVTTDQALAASGNTGTIGIPTRVVTIPANKVMSMAATGLHDGGFVSADSGRVFMFGQSSQCQLGNGTTTGPNTTYEILTDVNGHDFSGITSITPGWGPVSGLAFYAAIKATGGDTVWIWGNLTNINSGSTCAKPTPFIVAVGKTVSKIYAYNSSVHALCTDGTLYVIGGNDDYSANTGINSSPSAFTQVTFPGGALISYIAKGNAFVLAVSTTGNIYGFGELGWVCEGLSSPTYTVITSPTLMNTHLASIMPVDTIVANHVTWEAIKNDSTLWGAGSNEVGILGVGQTINWNTYTVSPSPTGGTPQYWNWDVGMGEFVTGLTQIAKGKHNFVHLFGGPQYSFYFFVTDANDSVYGAGREKAAGLLNGMVPADTLGTRIGSAYHMSWNITRLHLANPLGLISNGHTAQIVSKSPGCDAGLFTGTPCSFGTDAPSRPNTNLHAHLILTPVSGGFTWSTSTSTTDGSHKLMYQVSYITQTSGTSIDLGITGGSSGLVSAASGTYGLTYTLIDNSWDTVTDVESVTLGGQTGYFFSASGSDANACTFAAPCQTIAKFNSVYASLTGGDTVYFNRGDSFVGEINVSASGYSGNPIVVRAYGSGADPVIGGTLTLSGWTNVSGNIWSVPYSGPWINWASQNGVLMTEARTPNITTGYFIASAMTTGTITDAAHASLVTIGTKIIIRSSAFTIDTARVTGVAGSVISFSPSATYANIGGMGWAIFNNTPDSTGEIQDTLGSLRVFSVGSPSATYKIAASDTALIDNGTYHEWDSLHFTGSNFVNVVLPFNVSANISFKGCINDYSVDGYQYRSEGGVSVIGGFVQHMTNNGKLKLNLNNFNNYDSAITVYDIGMTPGMGRPGTSQPSYTGWIGGDSGSTVVNLFIDSVGYCGVVTYGSGFNVNYNLIKYWCQILEDGGAVYTWVSSDTAFARQRNIIGNICLNGGGTYSHNGDTLDYSSAANGIYLDAFSSNVLVKNNGVYNVNSCAYYDHGASNTFNGNISLNAAYSQFYVFEYTGGPTISGLSIKNSVLGFVPIGAYSIKIYTVNNDLTTFGVIDSNYYLVPVSITSTLYTKSSVDAGTARTLASWQSNTGYDTHTQYLQYAPLQFVYSIAGGSQSVYGINMDVLGNIYNGAITLTAYQSKILQTLSLPQLNSLKGGKIKFK